MLFLAEVVLVDVEHFDRSLDPHADLVAHHQVNQRAPVDQDNLGLDVVINFFGAGAFDFESASISCGNGAFEMLLEPGTGSTITTTKENVSQKKKGALIYRTEEL